MTTPLDRLRRRAASDAQFEGVAVADLRWVLEHVDALERCVRDTLGIQPGPVVVRYLRAVPRDEPEPGGAA